MKKSFITSGPDWPVLHSSVLAINNLNQIKSAMFVSFVPASNL